VQLLLLSLLSETRTPSCLEKRVVVVVVVVVVVEEEELELETSVCHVRSRGLGFRV